MQEHIFPDFSLTNLKFPNFSRGVATLSQVSRQCSGFLGGSAWQLDSNTGQHVDMEADAHSASDPVRDALPDERGHW